MYNDCEIGINGMAVQCPQKESGGSQEVDDEGLKWSAIGGSRKKEGGRAKRRQGKRQAFREDRIENALEIHVIDNSKGR